MDARLPGRRARGLEPSRPRHRVAGARELCPVQHRHVGLLRRDLPQRFPEEAARQGVIIEPPRAEQAVEGAPIGVDEAQRPQQARDGGARRRQHRADDEGPQAVEAARLPQGGAGRGQQVPQCAQQRRHLLAARGGVGGRGGARRGILGHGPVLRGRAVVFITFHSTRGTGPFPCPVVKSQTPGRAGARRCRAPARLDGNGMALRVWIRRFRVGSSLADKILG